MTYNMKELGHFLLTPGIPQLNYEVMLLLVVVLINQQSLHHVTKMLRYGKFMTAHLILLYTQHSH